MLPFVVAGPGASGSFSMLENRNCMGHDVNDDTREGDSDVGTGNTGPDAARSIMRAIVERGCHRVAVAASLQAAISGSPSAITAAMAAGSMNGVKWFQSSRSMYGRVRELFADLAGDGGRPELVDLAREDHDRRLDLRQVPPRGVAASGVERARLVFGIALQPDALGGGVESVGNVEAKHVGVECHHRWLRGVVGDRLVERLERRSSLAGTDRQRRAVVLVAVVRVDLARREHDRFEGHDRVEQAGIAMCRHQQAGATHRVPESDQPAVGSHRPSGCERIVAVSLPLDLPVVGAGGVAVAPVVDGVRREVVGQCIGDREVAVPVESRCM